MTMLVFRHEAARGFLRWLVVAPLLFLLLFLLSPATGLLFGGDPVAASPLVAADTPLVEMVVFDELPLASLLDGDGQIDADTYPAFAGLAANSTLARNHTLLTRSIPVGVK